MSMLKGTPRPQLQQWLSEAVTAYAQLMAGQKVVSASYAQGNGAKSVTFTQANIASLSSWILQLQRELGINRRRPMRPYFL